MMGDREEDILQRAFDRAKAYELASGGCPQCTLAGVFEALGVQDGGGIQGRHGTCRRGLAYRQRSLRRPVGRHIGHRVLFRALT